MASAVPMDAADATDLSRRHGAGGPLAVSKASGKIGKGWRRPVPQPRPAPTVYKIEAGNFRSLVQELTGTAPVETAVTPKSTGNSRLHKIAPPPLRPTFSYPSGAFGAGGAAQSLQQFNGLPPLPSPTNGHHHQAFNNISFGGFNTAALSPLNQRLPPISMLSPHAFSPLPALSPNDQLWANALESPSSATIRHLAQSIASAGDGSEGQDARTEGQHVGGVSAAGGAGAGMGSYLQGTMSGSASQFSLSPRLSAQYPNLPSPTGIGMASGFGIGNLYQMGALHSPTAAAMDFAFQEPDFMLTNFA